MYLTPGSPSIITVGFFRHGNGALVKGHGICAQESAGLAPDAPGATCRDADRDGTVLLIIRFIIPLTSTLTKILPPSRSNPSAPATRNVYQSKYPRARADAAETRAPSSCDDEPDCPPDSPGLPESQNRRRVDAPMMLIPESSGRMDVICPSHRGPRPRPRLPPERGTKMTTCKSFGIGKWHGYPMSVRGSFHQWLQAHCSRAEPGWGVFPSTRTRK
jgi:hypothetical protein